MDTSLTVPRKSKDVATVATLVFIAVLMFVLAAWAPGDELRLPVLVTASVVVLGLTFLVPNWSITIAYPLTWIIWSLNIEAVGGGPERLIVVLGLLGMPIMLGKFGKMSLGVTRLVGWGLATFVSMFVMSFYANPVSPEGVETIVSVASRVLFLFLVMFHIRTEQDLKVASIVYIAAAFVPAILAGWLGLQFGFGFIRVGENYTTARLAVDPLLLSTSFSAGFATAPALFLLAFYPWVRKPWSKRLLIVGVLFLLAMAFVSQLRREIMIAIPVLLGILALDKASGVKKIASQFFLVVVVAFPLLILPNFTILQMRFHDENPQIAGGTDPRLMNFAAGLSAFAESPVFGTGPGSYTKTVIPFLGYNQPTFLYSPYNVFIWAAVETGFLSVVGLLLILYGVLREGMKWRSGADGLSGLVLRISPALIAQIIIWFTFGAGWVLSLPWFLMGIILAAARITKEKTVRLVR